MFIQHPSWVKVFVTCTFVDQTLREARASPQAPSPISTGSTRMMHLSFAQPSADRENTILASFHQPPPGPSVDRISPPATQRFRDVENRGKGHSGCPPHIASRDRSARHSDSLRVNLNFLFSLPRPLSPCVGTKHQPTLRGHHPQVHTSVNRSTRPAPRAPRPSRTHHSTDRTFFLGVKNRGRGIVSQAATPLGPLGILVRRGTHELAGVCSI